MPRRTIVFVVVPVALVVLSLAAGVVRQPAAAPTADPARSSLGDGNQARLVLERHCGTCHREDSPEAKRGALAVFNLNRADWAAAMSEDRLRDARNRLRDMQPKGRSDDKVLDGLFGGTTTADEVALFDGFVDSELHRRENRRRSPN
jgi:hypothetical protein